MENKLKKKINTAILAGMLATTTGGVAEVKNNSDIPQNNETFIEENIVDDEWYHQREYDYYLSVKNEDLENYDKNFVDFYHNGIFKIFDVEYPVKRLYVSNIYNDNEHYIFLMDTLNVKYDIFSGKSFETYSKKNFQQLRNTNLFYDLFIKFYNFNDNCIKVDSGNYYDFLEVFKLYDGSLHSLVPETKVKRR